MQTKVTVNSLREASVTVKPESLGSVHKLRAHFMQFWAKVLKSSSVRVKVGKTEWRTDDRHDSSSFEKPLAASCYPVCQSAALQSAHPPCGITLFTASV